MRQEKKSIPENSITLQCPGDSKLHVWHNVSYVYKKVITSRCVKNKIKKKLKQRTLRKVGKAWTEMLSPIQTEIPSFLLGWENHPLEGFQSKNSFKNQPKKPYKMRPHASISYKTHMQIISKLCRHSSFIFPWAILIIKIFLYIICRCFNNREMKRLIT